MKSTNIDLFLENTFLLEDLFGAKAHNITIKFSALIATLNNQKLNGDTLTKNLHSIQLYTDVGSVFRGENALLLAVLMHISKNPEEHIKCTLSSYSILETYFDSNSFLALTSEILCSSSNDMSMDDLANKLGSAFSYTQKHHNFLADKEDLSICALIATYFENIQLKIEEANQCYKHLNDIRFFPSKNLILLSQALIFSNQDIESKTLATVRLHDLLEQRNFVIDGRALPILGFATMLDEPIESLVSKIISTQKLLRENVRFMTYTLDDDIELAIGISLCISNSISLKDSALLIPLTVFLLNLVTRDVNFISEPFSRKMFEDY
ncbi:DUF4003 family protein [uncultured Clostridium sp.]|uniref:DUF4003 family protein n=1 Tax=uncultured Clostridium sp. TaxID=59620 RepID=UPI002621DEBD|nr:DUF4003 family protein [uncultured Clostridium sp.]